MYMFVPATFIFFNMLYISGCHLYLCNLENTDKNPYLDILTADLFLAFSLFFFSFVTASLPTSKHKSFPFR